MAWTLWIILGSIMGGLSVGFGAFGAHALKGRLSPEDLAIFEVGVRYQMYHALALLACGFVAMRVDNTAIRIAGTSFLVGTLIFSGSLYGLSFGAPRWLGAVTPIGGVAYLIAWTALAVSVIRA